MQPSEIEVAGIKLVLGMPLDAVASQLSKYCDVQRTDSGDFSSWIVSEKGSGARGEFTALASLAFRSGKLISVLKNWHRPQAQIQSAGVSMATSIYGAISSFVQERRSLCTIDIGQKDTPQSEAKSAFIACGNKYIRIDITEIKGGENKGSFASIVEVLEDPTKFEGQKPK